MLHQLAAKTFINFQHHGLRKKINQLTNSDFLSCEEILDFQYEKLKKLINHAYLNVPYYRLLFDSLRIKPTDIQTIDDLRIIPILDKNTIQSNYSLMIASDAKNYYKRTTTGSTGVPLCVYYDYNNKLNEIALMQRFLISIGKEFGSKEINLWGRPDKGIQDFLNRKIKGLIYNTNYLNVYRFTEDNLDNVLCELVKNPKIHLRGFTNVIYILACKLQEMGKQINVDAVSVTAEKLLQSQREVIETYLTKNLYDQYGCGEINCIAFECNKHAGLHHAFEHSIIEIVNNIETKSSESNDSGELVITNLDNYAMPLLRYRNGDIITLTKQKCTCGRHSQLITNIDGRLYDFIEGINGNKIHSAFLDHILVDSHVLFKYNVKEIRIIQTGLEQINIQYVSNNTIPEEEFDKINNEIYAHLGLMKIAITKKERLASTKNGKRKFVIPYSDFLQDPSIL